MLVLDYLSHVFRAGGYPTLIIILFTSFYFIVRIIVLFLTRLRTRSAYKGLSELKDVAFLYLFIFVFTALKGNIIGYIATNVDINYVRRISLLITDWDLKIFGVYPWLWMHDIRNPYKEIFDNFAQVLSTTYFSLGTVMGFSWVFLLIKHPRTFIRISLAWFLSSAIALPIWYYLPALSPQELYIDKTISIHIPEYLLLSLEYFKPTDITSSYLTTLDRIWNSSEQTYLAVTSFPSMHIAFITIILFYGVTLYRKLLILLSIYWSLMCISTVFLLQHFFVDIPSGILVAMFAIWISNTLIQKVPGPIARISEAIRRDIFTMLNVINKLLFKKDYGA